MLNQHPVFKAADIDDDRVAACPVPGEAAMDHDIIAFRRRKLVFVTQVRRAREYAEQAFPLAGSRALCCT